MVFTSISLAQPHILLMDEPTNNLDMHSIDALADALEQAQAPFFQKFSLLSHLEFVLYCLASLAVLQTRRCDFSPKYICKGLCRRALQK